MVGVILAGGAGRRLGGGKAGRVAAGRPLAACAADALAAVAETVAIVGKSGEGLPDLPGVERWDDEPREPRHPAMGIVHALDRAGGEPVLVCAADMPFVGAGECAAIAEAASPSRAVVASAGDVLEPLLGLYPPAALGALHDGALRGAPMRALAAELDPLRVELPARALRSVNSESELRLADGELRQLRSIT